MSAPIFRSNLAIFCMLGLLNACGGGGSGGGSGGGGSGSGGTSPDTTAPAVISTTPANNATSVALDSPIVANFNESMAASTITTSAFTVDNGAIGTVAYSGTTATFTPSANLSSSTTYTATVSTAVKDAAGNPLAADVTWKFTTLGSSLNDTGLTVCDDGSNALVNCPLIDNLVVPRQDARFGRDAEALAGTLVKKGSGAAGFDYTKVCMDGTLDCAGAASNADLPSATEWACTRDNHTDLTWSLQSGGDTWGNATDPANLLNATTHAAVANAASRCGFASGWRLPTRRELLSIVHNGGVIPTIDIAMFPGAASAFYWSSDENASFSSTAWIVNFNSGNAVSSSKTNVLSVRLVRAGP